MTDVPSLLKRTREQVTQCLQEFLPATHAHPDLHALYQMMWDYPSRVGKGLRATLCSLTCRMLGGNPQHALATATAIELFQNWILIHDDIEDGSDLRRGEPCLHLKVGIPMAINVGDALHAQMWRLLHSNVHSLGYELTFGILDEFMQMVDLVVAGQHIELSWVEGNLWDQSEDDYYTMCERKTASYTCIAPCRLGARIAHATSDQLEALQSFGRTLGIAFQLQDDLLNLTGDESKYGKEIAGDLWEGKRTLILIHLLQHAPAKVVKRTRSILEQPRTQKQADDIQWILDAMHTQGSIEYVREEAHKQAVRARQQFDRHFSVVPDMAAQKAFSTLIDFMTHREY